MSACASHEGARLDLCDAVAQLGGLLEVVGDQESGDGQVPLVAVDLPAEGLGGVHVQAGEGLVQEEQPGGGGHGPGQGHALLFPAAQLGGPAVGQGLQSEPGEEVPGPVGLAPFVEAETLHGDSDVGAGREVGKEEEVLEHHAHLALEGREPVHGPPVEPDAYVVKASDVRFCQASVTLIVQAPEGFEISLTSTEDTIRAGEEATLTASGASTYAWSETDLSGATPSISPTANTTYTVTGTDANDCVDTESITIVVVEAATDTTDNDDGTNDGTDSTETYVNSYDQVQLTLYPNPSDGKLYIESEETIDKVEIYNQTTLVKTIAPQEGKEIDLSGLPAGVYFIRLYSGESVLVRKISIIR